MALNKERLSVLLQDKLDLSKQESRQLVDRLIQIMKGTLASGEDVLISGFGKFSVRQKRSRNGRNPQTKEHLALAARRVLVFKSSGVLRQRLNGS